MKSKTNHESLEQIFEQLAREFKDRICSKHQKLLYFEPNMTSLHRNTKPFLVLLSEVISEKKIHLIQFNKTEISAEHLFEGYMFSSFGDNGISRQQDEINNANVIILLKSAW